jgi:hypothetical protein
MDTSSARPFAYNASLVNKIAVGLATYILICIYPAYGLLRGWWMGDFSSFAAGGLLTAVATAVAFGWFARVTMRKYLRVDDHSIDTVSD